MKIYVPNGVNNLSIDEKIYYETIGEVKRKVPTTKDKSVHGKQCNICLRKTLLYVHSTTRHFTQLTGRQKYIYGKMPYVVCAECIDIIRKIRLAHYLKQHMIMVPYREYVPTNSDITNYKKLARGYA